MADDSVKLLGGLLVIVALAGEANAEAVRNVLDASGPDGLVQASINADILGAHVLLGKGADSLDGGGGTLLEGAVKTKSHE